MLGCNAPAGGPPPQKSNRSSRLMSRIAEYTIISIDIKVAGNSFFICKAVRAGSPLNSTSNRIFFIIYSFL
jgi:hypothetical protein